ncbi:hypothetical protein [Shewanella marisflavi]|uniref:Uncharacterized protein n=1 Tax=Shewanella marisflavi TaxID=260364 RepID=A0AAC9XMD9_9GAMM|nr:hypothetical protein [Shewanella marisflavi]ASJ95796.1 hypothetical protein CFF01_03865 [Shewanella marisflavi]
MPSSVLKQGLWTLAIGLYFWGTPCFGERLRAPDFVPCDRNHLTSWQGEVFNYHRSETQIDFGIRTLDGTIERLNIAYQLEQMRLNGGLFTRPDWKTLELSPGVLKPSVAVRVWRCEQAGVVSYMIDWRN